MKLLVLLLSMLVLVPLLEELFQVPALALGELFFLAIIC